ncbi:PTS sugar transporter subunit IIB [uncultured Enorma sp.]|uniref:PTS system mannose/fructose/N-acetylgalactosamine-transporter subunit IIB n=1 Tax=uncultured Enorma sp. TaxID=1714346 RepID=UPI0028054D0D|nr:PTS sugar transporter subunit IIB [uncultured Enorma sp.]
MAIVDARIDDRLVHGQVCSFWIPKYNVDRIVVVDDAVAKDDLRKSMLRMACPERCKLSIFDTAKAADKFSRHIDEGIKVMILCNSPVPILQMAKYGFKVEYVTVGNMSGRPGSQQIAKTAYATPEEIEAFRELAAQGIEIYDQLVPNDIREDITKRFL